MGRLFAEDPEAELRHAPGQLPPSGRIKWFDQAVALNPPVPLAVLLPLPPPKHAFQDGARREACNDLVGSGVHSVT